jgi:hypothetical protein
MLTYGSPANVAFSFAVSSFSTFFSLGLRGFVTLGVSTFSGAGFLNKFLIQS